MITGRAPTSNPLIRVAFEHRRLRDRAQVDAFDRALGGYAAQRRSEDLADLYATFTDASEDHEVMSGLVCLVRLVETFPTADRLRVYLRALPRLMSEAPGWADTIMARSLNGPESNAMLRESVGQLPDETKRAVLRLLTDLAETRPRPVGVRAEEMLTRVRAQPTESVNHAAR